MMDQFQIARDDHQQIVESCAIPPVSWPLRSLLSVPERGLRLAAIADFILRGAGWLRLLARSLGYQLFEIAVDPSRFLLCLDSKQRVYCGDELIRLDRLDQIGIGAAI